MKRAQFDDEASAALSEERDAFRDRSNALAALFAADSRDKGGTLLMTDSLEAIEQFDSANARWDAAKASVQRYVDMIRSSSIEG